MLLEEIKKNRFTLATLVLASVQAVNFIAVLAYFLRYGHLPQLFIFDRNNTFMDFFHPMYWSMDDGRYTVWKSVYPPLNFFILGAVRLVSFGDAQFVDGFDIRAHAHVLNYLLVVLPIACMWLTIRSPLFHGLTQTQRRLISAFVILSTPLLFGIERGNVVVFLPPLIAYTIVATGWRRSLTIAVLINIKPYFVILALVYLLKWRPWWFLATGAAAGGLFLVSGMLVDPNFPLMFRNVSDFATILETRPPGDFLVMDTSLDVLRYTLQYYVADGVRFHGITRDVVATETIIRLTIYIGVISIIGAAAFARNRVSFRELFAALILVILNFSMMPGGYALVLLVPVFPILYTMRLRSAYFALIAICFMPLNWITAYTSRVWPMVSFLTSHHFKAIEHVGIGGFLRPFASFTLMVLIAFEFAARTAFAERLFFSTTPVAKRGDSSTYVAGHH